MVKILVYGGRDYTDLPLLCAALDHLHQRFQITALVHGGAPGADVFGGLWAAHHLPEAHITVCRARWDDLSHPDAVIRRNRFGKLYDARAGHRRNQEMLDLHRPDFAVEFPGGTGTADMRRRLISAGVPIIQVGAASYGPFLQTDGRSMQTAPGFLL